MFGSVRAAGFAAVMLGFAISFASPLAAFEGDASAATAVLTGTLDEQVAGSMATETADAEQDCLASAIYFEARGEPIKGQLAVAEVVLNRVASKKYPDSICAVVKQPWQFSFVKDGKFPAINKESKSWRKAVAVARIARENLDQK